MKLAVPDPAAPLARVLARLSRVTPNGVGYYARCPVHGDEGAALHVRADASGRLVLRCPAGCKARAIVDALGFAADDLRPDATPAAPAPTPPATPERPDDAPSVFLCDSRASSRALSEAGYTSSWLDVPDGIWRDDLATAYAGLEDVVIVPDGGARASVTALRAAGAIHRQGVAVRLVRLPGLGASETVADWLDRTGEDEADAVDAFEAAVTAAPAWRPEDAPPPAPSKFTVLTDTALEALRPPAWLWEGLLPAGALGALIGQPGAGKSFVALDLAARIAAGGGHVLGRPAMAGTVLYVAAEGTAGLPQRLAAWKHAHGHAGHSIPLRFITEAVNLFAPGDDVQLVAACRQIATPERPVRLVILDTLARVMPGGEENSAKDVGLVIAHAERIRRETGAAVLLVHHTSKYSDQERGSSALRGAVDTILLIKTDDPDSPAGVKLLVTDKQKDAAPAEPVVFTLEPVAADTAHGRVTSCRVVLSAVRWTDAPDDANAPLTRTQLDALRVLRDCFGTSGATATEWLDATGLAKRTFYRSRAALDRAGAVLAGHGRGSRFQATAAGLRALSAPPNPVGAIGANSVPPTVPPGGGSQPLKGAGNPHPSRDGSGAVAVAPTRRTAGPTSPAVPTRREAPDWWERYDRPYSDDEAPG